MIPKTRRPASALIVLVALVVLGCVTVPITAEQPTGDPATLYPTDYIWRDAAGEPLPFQDHETIREVLRTAPIVSSELMGRGIAGNVELTLEHEGRQIRAVLRLVEVKKREDTASKRIHVTYRDSNIFEIAAYELDQMLGIGRVPPTVVRSSSGQPKTVQIYMEGVAPEDILVEEGRLKPPDSQHWWHQKGIMWVFDALIANTDRNQGNLLIDDDWNIWFIDHTRAFRETSVLLGVKDLNHCERRLWTALKNLDKDQVRARMEPYLTSREIAKLLLRYDKLIKHFEKKIKKRGEDKVFYELDR